MKRILFICFFVFLVFNGYSQISKNTTDSTCFNHVKYPTVTLNSNLYNIFEEIIIQSEKCNYHIKDEMVFIVVMQKIDSVFTFNVEPYYIDDICCLDSLGIDGGDKY